MGSASVENIKTRAVLCSHKYNNHFLSERLWKGKNIYSYFEFKQRVKTNLFNVRTSKVSGVAARLY